MPTKVSFSNKFRWQQSKLDAELANGTVVTCSRDLVLSQKKADYSAETPPNLIDESVGVTTTENAESIRKTYSGRKVFDFSETVGT